MYRRISWSSVALASILVAACGEQLEAQTPLTPQSYAVKYWTHSDPSDATSPVEFEIKLTLKNVDSDGDEIGWGITNIRIQEYDANAVLLQTWSQDNPSVPTPDGLWWVSHADPKAPERDEFLLPPHLVGTAAAQNPADADLEYDLEGVALNPPPLYDVTAGLDYELIEEGEVEPIGNGSDEPIEVPPGYEDPGD